MFRLIIVSLILVITLSISGFLVLRWDTASYFYHLAAGQYRIIADRQPIREMIADPATDESLRRSLKQVQAIRAFAEKEMKLPAERQFLYYVDHGRPQAVWNVYAAPELSMRPKTWCFPIAGCTVYKGFFDFGKASALADELRSEGYDVHVSGTGGYSTLGWFSDPIFRNILERGEIAVAAYIFHELAHNRIYIRGDTRFNEGFAVAVEQEGVRRWLKHTGRMDRFDEFVERQRRRAVFTGLVRDTRTGLSALFTQAGEDESPDEIRRRKAAIFEQMQMQYLDLKTAWHGYEGYDWYFGIPLNNARLIPIGAYYDHAPGFTAMIRAADGNMEAFYEAVETLSRKPRPERDQILAQFAREEIHRH